MFKHYVTGASLLALIAAPAIAAEPIRPSAFAAPAAAAPAAPQGRGRATPPRSNVATLVLAALGAGATGLLIAEIASRGRSRDPRSPR